MTNFTDKSGLQGVEGIALAGATKAIGMVSNSISGLEYAAISFTNYSLSHNAVIDCDNTDATVATQHLARLARLLADAGVIKLGV